MILREPWRTRLLFVSFAINLLLIPTVASHLWPRRPPINPGLPRTEMIISHMAADLTPADAALWRDTMEKHIGEIETARLTMLAARRAMQRAIGRTPYDPAAVQATMHGWQEAWQKWSETLGQGIVEALPTLSDDGRRALSMQGRRPT